jgi:Dyp-type peroxidase family
MAIELDDIQGNIFGGFNKDFQNFLFLSVQNATAARAWVKTRSPDFISTSREVLRFNNIFKQLLAEGIEKPEVIVQARWANIAFSFRGLQVLGFGPADLGTLPPAFVAGMAARSSQLGDVGSSSPTGWLPPFAPAELTHLHAVLLVAADTLADLNQHVQDITTSTGFAAGFNVLGTVHGRTRVDEVGHEHFGFKDGVSQPGIRGLDNPDDPLGNPDQGHPGQDLLWPGEFVLGYPTQKPVAKPGHDGPNPDPGPDSVAGNPAFTRNGSFLVFRRLAQDVPHFHEQVALRAREHGLSVDLMGAKLVGRYRSGCPLEALKFAPSSPPSPTDPGLSNPTFASSDALNNNFEFGDDETGARVPLAAHIRKAYPRDEHTPPSSAADSESVTQTHRLLRRGIPFGASFGAASGGGANDPRGLCFLAYQSDIQSHFEFVQEKWVNDPAFPADPAANTPGEDPVIAQSASGSFQLGAGTPNFALSHFVKTTGGEYFFAPSLETLTTRF